MNLKRRKKITTSELRLIFKAAWLAAGYEILPSEPLIHPLFVGFNPSAGESLAKEALERDDDFRQAIHAVALREYDRGGVWPHTALFEMAACFVRPVNDLVTEMAVNLDILKNLGVWPGGQKDDYQIDPDREANDALRQLGVKLVWDKSDETLLWWGRSTLADTIPALAPRAEIYFEKVEVAMFEQLQLRISPNGDLEEFRPILVMGIGLDRLASILLGYRPGMDDLANELVNNGLNQPAALKAVDAFRAIVLPMGEGAIPGHKKRGRRNYILRQFFHDLLAIELRYPDLDWDGVYRDFGQKLRQHFEEVHEVGIDEFFVVLPHERELALKLVHRTGPKKGG